MDAKQEAKLRLALVSESTSAKKARQAVAAALVYLAPLRRLLVTLETDPTAEDFEEARRLLRNVVQLLDDSLDG